MNAALFALSLALASAAPPSERIGQPDPTPPYKPLAITLLLAGLGAAALVLKKRAVPSIDDVTLEVVASKALSPKVRVVLLRAEEREFLLSVGSDGASLISEWANETADIVVPEPKVEAREPKPEPPAARVEPAALALDWSPAIDGLLALRNGPRRTARE